MHLRKANKRNAPTRNFENALWKEGKEFVVGIDEVGRGAWAGPLTIAAAIIPKDKRLYRIRDSKLLNGIERESLFEAIGNWCIDWSVGHATNNECDKYGMSNAQKLAAQRAIESLNVKPAHALIDGKWNFVEGIIGRGNTTMVIKGDTKCLSIAAASILAKVTRDRMMKEHHDSFPEYEFKSNKGYPCPKHKSALKSYGPTPLHRVSWAFMKDTSYPQAPAPLKDPNQESLF